MMYDTKVNNKGRYLREYEKQMNMCIRCAYCFENCPIIKETGWDTDGAKGKVILSYGLLTGEIGPSKYIADKFFRCTFCRDCIERCPSKVDVVEIISSARAEMVSSGFALEAHKNIISNIKNIGNIYGDKEVLYKECDGKVPLFIGCQYLSRPNKTKKYIKILEKLEIEPLIGKEICCGFPMKALGFIEDYKDYKDKFKEVFPYKDALAICPTCTVLLRESYKINARNVLEEICKRIPDADIKLKVTYHDPCDFSRNLKIIDEPREILKKLGVEIVEMKNSKTNSRCCGGGGGILMTDQKLSNDIAKKRVMEAIETGVDTIVTSCPTCETVLKKAAQEIGESINKTIYTRSIEDIIWMGVEKC